MSLPLVHRGDSLTHPSTQTELLDDFTERKDGLTSAVVDGPEVVEEGIGIRAASFTWNGRTDGATTPGSRNFTLQIEDEVAFKRGCINLIIGQTGSGKTSLLMALLGTFPLLDCIGFTHHDTAGEMHYTPMNSNSMVSLPRGGGIAYHAQESWVLNETIRVSSLHPLSLLTSHVAYFQENILFGSPYDEARYNMGRHDRSLVTRMCISGHNSH